MRQDETFNAKKESSKTWKLVQPVATSSKVCLVQCGRGGSRSKEGEGTSGDGWGLRKHRAWLRGGLKAGPFVNSSGATKHCPGRSKLGLGRSAGAREPPGPSATASKNPHECLKSCQQWGGLAGGEGFVGQEIHPPGWKGKSTARIFLKKMKQPSEKGRNTSFSPLINRRGGGRRNIKGKRSLHILLWRRVYTQQPVL